MPLTGTAQGDPYASQGYYGAQSAASPSPRTRARRPSSPATPLPARISSSTVPPRKPPRPRLPSPTTPTAGTTPSTTPPSPRSSNIPNAAGSAAAAETSTSATPPPAVITAGPARLDRKRSPARRTVTRGIDVSSSPRATAAISRTSCARLASTAWRFSRPVRHPPPGNTSTRWIASRGGHSPIPRYSPSRWWAARRTPLRCLPTPPPSAPSWTPSRRPRFSGANFADSTRRRRLRNDRRRRAARPSGSITESPPVRRRAREADQSQRRRRLCAGTRLPRTAGG